MEHLLRAGCELPLGSGGGCMSGNAMPWLKGRSLNIKAKRTPYLKNVL